MSAYLMPMKLYETPIEVGLRANQIIAISLSKLTFKVVEVANYLSLCTQIRFFKNICNGGKNDTHTKTAMHPMNRG
jgi:hypothetical protein